MKHLNKYIILSISFCALESHAQTTQKPNLLFIMTDQQRFDALSIAGNKVLKTPNLDRLAKQGARFINAYTPCAFCCPARSSILTGTSVENNGMKVNEYAYSYEKEGLMTTVEFCPLLPNIL